MGPNFNSGDVYMRMILTSSGGIGGQPVIHEEPRRNGNNIRMSVSRGKSGTVAGPARTAAATGTGTGTRILNTYASQNPSLFGTGVGVATNTNNASTLSMAGRANMGSMLIRLKGLSPGCGSCGKK